MSKSQAAQAVDAWFAARGWKVFPFQRAVWKAALAGESGLLHANTGSGKTYAVWFAALQRGMRAARPQEERPAGAVDHADARAGRRHPARAGRIGGRPCARLDHRRAHRRHHFGRTRAPARKRCRRP